MTAIRVISQRWTAVVPVLAAAVLLLTWGRELPIAVMAIATIWLDGPLLLGLSPTHMVLLALTVVTGTLTIVPGRATLLQGGVHLGLFAAFLFLAISP